MESIVKDNNIKIRVTQAQKDMIEFMANKNNLSVSAYLIFLATRDFNNDELKNYIIREEN